MLAAFIVQLAIDLVCIHFYNFFILPHVNVSVFLYVYKVDTSYAQPSEMGWLHPCLHEDAV